MSSSRRRSRRLRTRPSTRWTVRSLRPTRALTSGTVNPCRLSSRMVRSSEFEETTHRHHRRCTPPNHPHGPSSQLGIGHRRPACPTRPRRRGLPPPSAHLVENDCQQTSTAARWDPSTDSLQPRSRDVYRTAASYTHCSWTSSTNCEQTSRRGNSPPPSAMAQTSRPDSESGKLSPIAGVPVRRKYSLARRPPRTPVQDIPLV